MVNSISIPTVACVRALTTKGNSTASPSILSRPWLPTWSSVVASSPAPCREMLTNLPVEERPAESKI